MPKTPIEKAIDANTAAIKELTQVFKVRSKDISLAVTGISECLKRVEMTEEGLLIGGSDDRKHRKTHSDQNDGNRGESDR